MDGGDNAIYYVSDSDDDNELVDVANCGVSANCGVMYQKNVEEFKWLLK